MYIIILGSAGTGKSVALKSARSLLTEIEDVGGTNGIHIAPTSMTMAALADELNDAKRIILRPGHNPPAVEYNALTIHISEFSSFMHEYDKELMGGLTDIWDGGIYSQRRRGGGLKIKIENPQLNIFAASTPSNFVEFMPERAWDQGFASRMIMIYSGERPFTDIFAEQEIPEGKRELRDLLINDLHVMDGLYGKMVFSPEAVAAFREWREHGEKPVPDHPKLVDYCTRRTAHLIKLCMVSSVSSGDNKVISAEDFDRAKHWLLGAELTMPDVFRAGRGGGDSKAMDEAWHFIMITYSKRGKKPVPEHELVHFVRERVPSQAVIRVIDIMERDGTLKATYSSKGKLYEPGPRQPNTY